MQTIEERLKSLVNPSRRKLTLFACSCVRQIWHLLKDERNKQAIIAAENYVDGLISKKEMQQAYYAVDAAWSVAAAYHAAIAASADAGGNNKQLIAQQHQLFEDIFLSCS